VQQCLSSVRPSVSPSGLGGLVVALTLALTPTPHMQAAASAPLCNLALYFSPVQEQIVAAGGLAQLAALTQRNNEPSLRLNAVWALKNLTAMPSATAKAAVMTQLPYESLRSLLEETAEPSVQVRGVALRRAVESRVRVFRRCFRRSSTICC
jgi:hypothetical protein